MSDARRSQIGMAGVAIGLVLVAAGVLIAHFTALPETDAVGRDLYPSIPRCLPFETSGSCWMIPTVGQLIGLLGSQVMIGAVLFAWILGKPLTWARAAAGAGLFTLEAILLFGVVPNQWLALTQGTFEWTSQKIAFTLPSWLVLGNDVSISYAVIKDAVVGGYAAGLLATVAVAAYQIQERAKRRETTPVLPPAKVSAFGRTIVEGER